MRDGLEDQALEARHVAKAVLRGEPRGLHDGLAGIVAHHTKGRFESFSAVTSGVPEMRKAIENGHRGLFVKAQDLFDEMYASLADRSSRALVRRLARVDVLVIDEMGYLNLRPEQTNIFFKLMEERYRRKPTILTTNLDYEEWHGFLGNKDLVDALLSRVRHQCHTVRIDGPSLRDPQN